MMTTNMELELLRKMDKKPSKISLNYNRIPKHRHVLKKKRKMSRRVEKEKKAKLNRVYHLWALEKTTKNMIRAFNVKKKYD